LFIDTITSVTKKIKNDAVTTMSIPKTCESTEPTPSPSGLLENDAVFDPELSHPDCYEIVWYNSDVENPIKLNRLRQISDYINLIMLTIAEITSR
jgi:hypothetical protein